jgi:hypothetical protein
MSGELIFRTTSLSTTCDAQRAAARQGHPEAKAGSDLMTPRFPRGRLRRPPRPAPGVPENRDEVIAQLNAALNEPPSGRQP